MDIVWSNYGYCLVKLWILFGQIAKARHFGSYKESKLRETRLKGRNSAVKSSQLSWAGQYKMCVQYDFKFTSVYSESLKGCEDKIVFLTNGQLL